MGAIPAGVGSLSESQTVTRYGVSGAQLQEVGNRLMAQAAYKRGMQPGPTSPTVPPQQGPSTSPMQAPSPASAKRQTPTSTEMAGYARRNAPIPESIDPIQARNDAIARHIGNYISAASQRMEGPASIQGVKLKGAGQKCSSSLSISF
jgi:predicted component of type VI protein secretion system